MITVDVVSIYSYNERTTSTDIVYVTCTSEWWTQFNLIQLSWDKYAENDIHGTSHECIFRRISLECLRI